MSTVHWIGAGLSSGPGIRRLVTEGKPLVLWNRTVSRAREALEPSTAATADVRGYTLPALEAALQAGDIVVSMVPAPMHPEVARSCLKKRAHLVTTSYVSDAMRGLDSEAKSLGLSFLNEAGLDPGIDHLLAHALVHELQAAPEGRDADEVAFLSLCGGFPQEPGEFRYKFSWSPAGVLRALQSPARFIDHGREVEVRQPWDALFPIPVRGETFEAYPNRDSVPFIDQYQLRSPWKIRRFMRGTLRPSGWMKAWGPLFERIPKLSPAEVEALAAELWAKHAYREGEEDRVVLWVGLRAFRKDAPVWTGARALSLSGTGRESAMGRAVSLPATLAVEWVRDGKAPAGVSAVPHDSASVNTWLARLDTLGLKTERLVGADVWPR